jgi:hypothetical protein
MISFFTTTKPFLGHSGIIQRNALQSWKLLHPDVEVILFGKEEGITGACAEFGLRHEPEVARDRAGLPYMNYMFDRAEEIARHDNLCYANCDIIFTTDLLEALGRVRAVRSEFLIVGRRWDTDIVQPLDFSNLRWQEEIRELSLKTSDQRDCGGIDYFLFSRRLLYKKIPGFVVGRPQWDNWLIWKALDSGIDVIDASAVVRAIHQNHGYASHPDGREGLWSDESSERNIALAGGDAHLRLIQSATYRLTADKLSHNSFHYLVHWRVTLERRTEPLRAFVRTNLWHPFLDLTRPVRHALGIKQGHATLFNRKRED